MVCFNTIGWRLSSTLVTAGVDWLSTYDCKTSFDKNGESLSFSENNITDWNDPDLRGQCKNDGGKFLPVVDGFYLETYILAGIGFVYWYFMSFRLIPYLEKQPEKSWKVKELEYEEVKAITGNSSSSSSTDNVTLSSPDKFESSEKHSPV